MLSEEQISQFLRLQQIVLDIEDGTRLLDQLLPKVLQELTTLGFEYEFLAAIFVDGAQNIKQTFFVEKNNSQGNMRSINDVINVANLFQKGNSWEMELFYGKPVISSEIFKLINNSYPKVEAIRSLLILPILNIHRLSGVLVIATTKQSSQILNSEIEFIEMVNRLIDLAFRLQDVQTSLTQITSQVYEMNAKLHQLDKLKDDFVSVASHELRTPMTAIRSYAWMALNKSDVNLSEKLKRYLIRVLISTERLINLVNDLLNISRIESGRIEINPEAVNIISLIKDVVDEVYYSKSTEKNVQFVINEKVLPKVFADPEKLRQVLLNLVGNSLKFTPVNGKIIFDFFTDGNTVETSVKDTGIGISKEDLTRLFKKFGRLDSSYVATASSGGTGLGLYISKNLIELMHGRIWASSEGIDKGSTFTFSLPVVTEELLKNAEKYRVKPKDGLDAKPLEQVRV